MEVLEIKRIVQHLLNVGLKNIFLSDFEFETEYQTLEQDDNINSFP